MDDLPPELVVKILNRLNDSEDLARSRVASKRLNSLWREVRAVNLVCTLPRYSKSRSIAVTPFKTIFKNLVEDSRNVRSVSIGVDKALSGMSFDDLAEEDSDELYLTDVEFVRAWLPRVRDDLETLSISDFWIQSCWRRSDVLALISSNCSKLVKLEVRNAWLSVVGLTQMPNLRHLTLEFIRLDDENLEMVNDCFPFLQVLNLIGVGGLKEPRIHLLHLKSCHWTVSNAPLSLAILAPNLLELRLKCNKPKSLVLETPKLVKFCLSVEDAEGVSFSELGELDTLEVVSPDMYRLIRNTRFGNKIRKLAVDSVKTIEDSERLKLGLGTLLEAFPGIVSLTLSHVTWSNIKRYFQREGLVHMKGADTTLKQITARVQTSDYADVSFIRYILHNCKGLTDVRLVMHQDTDPRVRDLLISACTMSNQRVRWRWGTWAEGGEDIWVSNGT
ncbi:F-box/LRR-repeat protein At4g29420-like [Raphanus sativus]|uniref:F-box/LRR-repeat protein At4g29420-like n=1 Tax=Raphanus sativus TaxID=3726 RepID=A0A9W3D6A9_RAPSA|nr:F-box/LRR-repeat protein At4g29420-like [Raphanus sativus]